MRTLLLRELFSLTPTAVCKILRAAHQPYEPYEPYEPYGSYLSHSMFNLQCSIFEVQSKTELIQLLLFQSCGGIEHNVAAAVVLRESDAVTY